MFTNVRFRPKRNRTGSMTFAVVVAVLTAGVCSTPASADVGFADRVTDALSSVAAEHRLLLDLADRGTVAARTPTDPSAGITVGSKSGASLTVSLPFADRAENGTDLAGGAIAYDNGNGSATVPIAKTDGSVQIATVIEHTTAPTSYQYVIDGTEGTTLRLLDEGVVLVENAEGAYQGAVGAPWAYDANGTPVATRYEVDGATLVQIVEHTAGSYAYPIVADPWLGINLFQWITVDSYNSQPRVNLQPSVWGAAQWGGGVPGQVIMNTAGWEEARNWNSTVRSGLNKDSQRQQFECHALGAPFAGVWNLEKVRPNRTVHWSSGVAVHRCNWKTATGH